MPTSDRIRLHNDLFVNCTLLSNTKNPDALSYPRSYSETTDHCLNLSQLFISNKCDILSVIGLY